VNKLEIEIRAFIKNVEDFKKRLVDIGAVFKSKVHIVDCWFCEKDKKSFDEVLQCNPGDYSLRIRKITKDSRDVYEFNCKVLEKLDDHNAFHEFETRVNDFDQLKNILEHIGFKVFSVLDKERTVFEFEKCLINVEDIKDFRPAVELEIIDDKNAEEHKAYLRKLLDRLGVAEEERIEKSITYHYMEEFAFKNENKKL